MSTSLLLKSVDTVDTPTRTVEGRLVSSKVPTDNIDEIHCFHSLSLMLDMKIAPSADILNPTKLFAFVGRFKESSLHVLKNQLETTLITEVPLRGFC